MPLLYHLGFIVELTEMGLPTIATVPVATMIYPLITIVDTITIAMDQVCIMIRNLE
jgi:hypothetical protein